MCVHIQEFVAFFATTSIFESKRSGDCCGTMWWIMIYYAWKLQRDRCAINNHKVAILVYRILFITFFISRILVSPSLCRAFCSGIALVSGGSTGSGFVLRAWLFLQPKDSNHPAALWRTARFKKKWMVLSCRSPAGTLISVDAFSFTSVNLAELMNWRMWACSYIFRALLSKWVTAQKWKTNQFH